MKAQGVRVRRKVKNHWFMVTEYCSVTLDERIVVDIVTSLI